MRKKFLATLLLVAFISCSGCQLLWARGRTRKGVGGEPYTESQKRYTVRLPVGWRFKESPPTRVLAIIDNEVHQRIIIKYTPLKDPLPYTQRTLTSELNARALADALTEDIIADPNTEGLSVLESGPAEIGGSPGCKVVVRFRNREIGRADMMKMFYSTIHDSQLYMIIYDAMAAEYYDRGLQAFDETVKSFKLNKP